MYILDTLQHRHYTKLVLIPQQNINATHLNNVYLPQSKTIKASTHRSDRGGGGGRDRGGGQIFPAELIDPFRQAAILRAAFRTVQRSTPRWRSDAACRV